MKVTFYRHSLFSRGGDRMVAEYANLLAQKRHAVVMYTNELSTVFEINPSPLTGIDPPEQVVSRCPTITLSRPTRKS